MENKNWPKGQAARVMVGCECTRDYGPRRLATMVESSWDVKNFIFCLRVPAFPFPLVLRASPFYFQESPYLQEPGTILPRPS